MPVKTNTNLIEQLSTEVERILATHSELPKVYRGLVFPTNAQPLSVIYYFLPDFDGDRKSGTNVKNTKYTTKLVWRRAKRNSTRREEQSVFLVQTLYEARNLFHLLRPSNLSAQIPGFFQSTAEVTELFAEEADPQYNMIDAVLGEMLVHWEFFEELT